MPQPLKFCPPSVTHMITIHGGSVDINTKFAAAFYAA